MIACIRINDTNIKTDVGATLVVARIRIPGIPRIQGDHKGRPYGWEKILGNHCGCLHSDSGNTIDYRATIKVAPTVGKKF